MMPTPLARETARQLEAYFAARLRRFDLTLDLQGTDFQKRVWHAAGTYPLRGNPQLYANRRRHQLAQSVRAVGAANGANPIPIVVPCHRVIGSNGKLVGYGGGLPLKKRLLSLEGALAMSLGL